MAVHSTSFLVVNLQNRDQRSNLMCIHAYPLIVGSTVRDNLPKLTLWCPGCGAFTYSEVSKGPRSSDWIEPNLSANRHKNRPCQELPLPCLICGETENKEEKFRIALESILANEIDEGKQFSFTASRARMALHGPAKEP